MRECAFGNNVFPLRIVRREKEINEKRAKEREQESKRKRE